MNVISNTLILNSGIPAEFLWFLLAMGIIFFFTMAWIFTHHWKYYGVKGNPKVFAKTLFWVVSVILILVMTLAITAFEIS